jgi:uncharacterized protein
MRVVFDTNIFVSALVFPASRADAALHRILEGHDKLLLSQEELSRVAVLLGDIAEVVRPKRSIHVLADVPDNRILECAVLGGADLIVTGIRTKKTAVEPAVRDLVRRRKARKMLALEGNVEIGNTVDDLIKRRRKDGPGR